MKWMAAGEIGAVIIGLIFATAAVLFFSDLIAPMKIAVFVAGLYSATKSVLWFVHLGYDETMRPKSSRH